jgi:cysteine synthase
MPVLGLEDHIVDQGAYDRTVRRFSEARVLMPTFAQLAEPRTIPAAVRQALGPVGPDEAHPLNLFRVHWYNDATRSATDAVPGHVVLGPELTGVDARIVVALGNRFPMIRAHKVLAAYACLAPRIVTGQFDPTSHRAVWPSTGNYCRGGVAISRLMGCRGVAVLPAGMSRERFAWLEDWAHDPGDVITTAGSEANIKEIYDKCAELSADPANVIFNQFAEFANHLAHYACTGRALGEIFEHLRRTEPGLRLRAFVSASGSAGTLGAGDRLKESYGARIVAVEALECPTLLRNGFGDHNIQGIGDKHVPLIHNVYNTDIVTAVSDRATDDLAVVFSSPTGLSYLADRRHVPPEVLTMLSCFGLSSIANIVAAVKTARYLDLGPDDIVITVATDGAEMYGSERAKIAARDFPGGLGPVEAAETFGRWVLGAGTGDLLETTARDRERMFNLGYFTWVEQQGVPQEDFVARRDPSFWSALRSKLQGWDEMIGELNSRSGVTVE